MKRRSIIAVAAAIALGLSACGSDSETASTQTTEPSDTQSSENETSGTEAGEGAMPTVNVDGQNTILEFPSSDAPVGLQTDVVEEGTGRIVEETDYVIANYVGQVWGNETPFDSSFQRGEPTGFSLQQVIPGWTQGLSGLPVGSKVILSIPTDLGYGPSGGNPNAGIGPEDTIAFYVEIVDAFGINQAGDPEATPEADVADLPIDINGDIGEPITIAVKDGAEEPTDAMVTVLARGDGEPVADNARAAYVQYAMTFWDNSATEETYGKTGVYTANLGLGSMFDELIGIEEGSRVLIEVPANDASDHPAFAVVLDILGAR